MQYCNVNSKHVCYIIVAAGILLLGQNQTDIAEAKALGHEDDIIEIYSNSWGPPDVGFIVAGPDILAKRTFEMGAQKVISYIIIIPLS